MPIIPLGGTLPIFLLDLPIWFLALPLESLGLSNCFPLLDTRDLGISNLHIIERQTKLCTFCYVIVAKGSALVHLVK